MNASANNGDKPVGIVIVILSVLGIIGAILGAIFMSVLTGFIATQASSHHASLPSFIPTGLFAAFGMLGLAVHIAELSILVWAGLGIMQSKRVAFIGAIICAAVSLVSGPIGVLGILILIYCGLRLTGNLGPAPV